MDQKRIIELADFFYSSDDSSEVPFRLALSFGMGGADLSYDGFVLLMEFLSKGSVTKQTATKLLEVIDEL